MKLKYTLFVIIIIYSSMSLYGCCSLKSKNETPLKVRDGITLFKGNIPSNLMFKPVVSNIYLLEDGDEVILFDTSCGKEIAKRVECYIDDKQKNGEHWKKATLIASHSHLDHANNFYLSDVIGAPETNIYVHESGFKDGKVMNRAGPFLENNIQETKPYYNFYWTFNFPYNLSMSLFGALDKLSPMMATKSFAMIGGLPWPDPVDGEIKPMPIKNADMQIMKIENIEVHGWKLGNKIILSTPGHSPCSISLYWPDKKALFIGDADWIGNPVFITGSFRDSVKSLNMMKELTQSGDVELLLSGHGDVKEGSKEILPHLQLSISFLEAMRQEILSAYKTYGEEKDVEKLASILTRESPLFYTLNIVNYPRDVFFVHNIVTVCLKEEGILN